MFVLPRNVPVLATTSRRRMLTVEDAYSGRGGMLTQRMLRGGDD